MLFSQILYVKKQMSVDKVFKETETSCSKKTKLKKFNMFEWRIIANKTRKVVIENKSVSSKIPRYCHNQYHFWNKATSKKWESIVANMVKIVCDDNKKCGG